MQITTRMRNGTPTTVECKVLGRWAYDEVLLKVAGETRQVLVAADLVAAGHTPDPGSTISAQIDSADRLVSWELSLPE